MNKSRTNRRSFFSSAGKGTIGALLLSSLPAKLLGNNKKLIKLKNVIPHPNAVKRR